LEARAGKDELTQRALERAAGRYALKALGLVDGETCRESATSPSFAGIAPNYAR
jgi:hypothetical protein